jgi:hypothetical protein
VSRLLIVNRAGKAYSGKEVLLIAGRPSYYLAPSECIYTTGVVVGATMFEVVVGPASVGPLLIGYGDGEIVG